MDGRLKKTTKALIYGRDGISPNVDKFNRDHGEEPISELIISCNIVLTGSLKIISTQFRERAGSEKEQRRIIKSYFIISLERNKIIGISP